jgi:hypothetical protein
MIKQASLLLILFCSLNSYAQVVYSSARDGKRFKVFQFPQDQIPRIDGDRSDWDMVPPSYTYDSSWLKDTEDGHGTEIDPEDLDVRVTVGWVKGLNRIYILYEAYDDFWDFERFNPQGYLSDIFEVVLDGNFSGGPFIYNPLLPEARKWGDHPAHIYNHLTFSGYHAQNYHIFTPPTHNSNVLVWGSQPWIAEFPQANFAYAYDFKHGESGNLVMECWLTPFDHAPFSGPEGAIESRLEEGKVIGLSWSILDFDGEEREGHFNLSHDTRMVMDASYLCAFELMPMEDDLLPELRADFEFQYLKGRKRGVSFVDASIGEVESWLWEFGDGESSTDQNPIHYYQKGGVHYNVSLTVNGPAGKDVKTRFWEVMVE